MALFLAGFFTALALIVGYHIVCIVIDIARGGLMRHPRRYSSAIRPDGGSAGTRHPDAMYANRTAHTGPL
jgi:hypothetical protein